MPTLDETLTRALRAATPDRDPLQVYQRLVDRRRSTRRRRTVARLSLALVVVAGTLGGVAVLVDAFHVDAPTPSPAATSVVIDEPHRIDGVPFEVCRSVAIAGDFGGGGAGVLYVVEEPNRSQEGCARGYEGFQRIAVAPDGSRVTVMSERLTDCLAVSRCWPAATPDLDGDGIDEIVLGIGWAADRTSTVELFGIWGSGTAPAVDRIELTCVPNQDCGSPWVFRASIQEPIRAGIHCPSAGRLDAFDVVADDGALTLSSYDIARDAASADGPLALMRTELRNVPAGGERAREIMASVRADLEAGSMCGAPFLDLQEADPARAEEARTVLEGDATREPDSPEPRNDEFELCDTGAATGDVDGDGVADRVLIGTIHERSRECADQGERQLVIDLGRDGVIDLEVSPPDCTTWCGVFAVADLDDDGIAEILLNEDHLAAPVSAVIAVYRYAEDELRPIRFPDDANRFALQYSWQGYRGAYCVAEGQVFSTWTTSDTASGLIEWLTLREYRLDAQALRFELVSDTTIEQPDAELPPKGYRGYDGRFCGLDVAEI